MHMDRDPYPLAGVDCRRACSGGTGSQASQRTERPHIMADIEQPRVQRGAVQQSQSLQHKTKHRLRSRSGQQCRTYRPDNSVIYKGPDLFHLDGTPTNSFSE